MKKTIYGVVVAVLGAVLGAGAMFFFGVGKPAAPAVPVAAATSPGGTGAGKAGKAGKRHLLRAQGAALPRHPAKQAVVAVVVRRLNSVSLKNSIGRRA